MTMVLKALLERNPPINPLMPGAQATPLHFAAYKGHAEIISLLLKKGANPNLQKAGGKTALYESADRGDLEIVKEMLEAGADAKILSNDQVSPVTYSYLKSYITVSHCCNSKSITNSKTLFRLRNRSKSRTK
jgi:ankyrin repeat protein